MLENIQHEARYKRITRNKLEQRNKAINSETRSRCRPTDGHDIELARRHADWQECYISAQFLEQDGADADLLVLRDLARCFLSFRSFTEILSR